MTRLFLLRPAGHSVAGGLAPGNSDAPAEPGGLNELLERLARRAPAAIVCAPDDDSRRLGERLAQRCGAPVRLDSRFALQPFDSGDPDQRTSREAPVLDACDALAAEFFEREVVLILHAPAQRAALARALGLEDGALFAPEPGQALALDWAHPLAREFTHALIGMSFDWDVAAPTKQVHKFPGGASVLPRS